MRWIILWCCLGYCLLLGYAQLTNINWGSDDEIGFIIQNTSANVTVLPPVVAQQLNVTFESQTCNIILSPFPQSLNSSSSSSSSSSSGLPFISSISSSSSSQNVLSSSLISSSSSQMQSSSLKSSSTHSSSVVSSSVLSSSQQQSSSSRFSSSPQSSSQSSSPISSSPQSSSRFSSSVSSSPISSSPISSSVSSSSPSLLTSSSFSSSLLSSSVIMSSVSSSSSYAQVQVGGPCAYGFWDNTQSPSGIPVAVTCDNTILYCTAGYSVQGCIPFPTNVTSQNSFTLWQGYILTPVGQTGSYTFSITVDDGADLYVNNVLIINELTRSGGQDTFNGFITLQGNTTYPLQLQYVNAGLNGIIGLSWQPPSQGSSTPCNVTSNSGNQYVLSSQYLQHVFPFRYGIADLVTGYNAFPTVGPIALSTPVGDTSHGNAVYFSSNQQRLTTLYLPNPALSPTEFTFCLWTYIADITIGNTVLNDDQGRNVLSFNKSGYAVLFNIPVASILNSIPIQNGWTYACVRYNGTTTEFYQNSFISGTTTIVPTTLGTQEWLVLSSSSTLYIQCFSIWSQALAVQGILYLYANDIFSCLAINPLITRQPFTYVGPLDAIAPGGTETSGISIRLLTAAYRGPWVQVRRDSDNATTNIFYDPVTGLANVAAANTFANGATLYVLTWYDQTYNGNHFLHLPTSNQPKLQLTPVSTPSIVYSGSEVLTLNSTGPPVTYHVGTVLQLTRGSILYNSNPSYGTPHGLSMWADSAPNYLFNSSNAHPGFVSGQIFINATEYSHAWNVPAAYPSTGVTMIQSTANQQPVQCSGCCGFSTWTLLWNTLGGNGLTGHVYQIMTFSVALTQPQRFLLEQSDWLFYFPSQGPFPGESSAIPIYPPVDPTGTCSLGVSETCSLVGCNITLAPAGFYPLTTAMCGTSLDITVNTGQTVEFYASGSCATIATFPICQTQCSLGGPYCPISRLVSGGQSSNPSLYFLYKMIPGIYAIEFVFIDVLPPFFRWSSISINGKLVLQSIATGFDGIGTHCFTAGFFTTQTFSSVTTTDGNMFIAMLGNPEVNGITFQYLGPIGSDSNPYVVPPSYIQVFPPNVSQWHQGDYIDPDLELKDFAYWNDFTSIALRNWTNTFTPICNTTCVDLATWLALSNHNPFGVQMTIFTGGPTFLTATTITSSSMNGQTNQLYCFNPGFYSLTSSWSVGQNNYFCGCPNSTLFVVSNAGITLSVVVSGASTNLMYNGLTFDGTYGGAQFRGQSGTSLSKFVMFNCIFYNFVCDGCAGIIGSSDPINAGFVYNNTFLSCSAVLSGFPNSFSLYNNIFYNVYEAIAVGYFGGVSPCAIIDGNTQCTAARFGWFYIYNNSFWGGRNAVPGPNFPQIINIEGITYVVLVIANNNFQCNNGGASCSTSVWMIVNLVTVNLTEYQRGYEPNCPNKNDFVYNWITNNTVVSYNIYSDIGFIGAVFKNNTYYGAINTPFSLETSLATIWANNSFIGIKPFDAGGGLTPGANVCGYRTLSVDWNNVIGPNLKYPYDAVQGDAPTVFYTSSPSGPLVGASCPGCSGNNCNRPCCSYATPSGSLSTCVYGEVAHW